MRGAARRIGVMRIELSDHESQTTTSFDIEGDAPEQIDYQGKLYVLCYETTVYAYYEREDNPFPLWGAILLDGR